MSRRSVLILAVLAALSLSCNFILGGFKTVSKEPATDTPIIEQQPKGEPTFSQVIFCEDVTDDGEPVNPQKEFPGGTSSVWAYFQFHNMTDGQTWGRLWEKDGEVYSDSRGESWEDGESGWLAYSISDSDDIPLTGEYRFTLFIEDQAVQEASFKVAPPQKPETSAFPAFGPIQFARQVTQEKIPVGVTSEFEPAAVEVYAVFPYINMETTTLWRREWLYNGEITAEKEETWEGKPEGVTWISLTSENGLTSGEYTLNLYLEGQLVRSANFRVTSDVSPTSEGPAAPEDLIDADLMPAWEMLYNAQDRFSFLHDIAQFALDHHIEIRMDETYGGEALAVYRYDAEACQPDYVPGKILVYRQTWNETSWEELAGILAHELTHAYQHQSGNEDYRCPGCSVNKEFYAFVAQTYTWWMLDRQDLIEAQIPAWNESGRFDNDLLWDAVKKAYGDSCPDY